MEEALKRKIEEIICDLKCSKDFKCYESGFDALCKAKDTGLESYLVCLEEHPEDCPFSLPFGHGHLCKCPLRVYIAKRLGK